MPVGELSADAVPMLSAAESPLLILEARPQPQQHVHRHVHNPLGGFPLRRKSSLPGDASTGSSGSSIHVRRRGSSVPPSSSSSSSCCSSSSASSSPSDASTAPGRALARGQTMPTVHGSIGPPPGASTRRRGFTLSKKFMSSRREEEAGRQRRRVTFKTALHPEVVPCPALLSYDELLFNVAGLYQTTDFLHDPEDFGEARARDEEDEHGAYPPPCSSTDDAPPLERSVPLMIAEFLYRSAVYLGYPTGDKPWIPGFRETKRFSSNDVRRWRRLAHFDWAREEREFEQRREQQQHKTDRGRRLRRKDSSSSVDSAEGYRVDEPAVPSTAVALPSEASARPRSRDRLRAAVSKMMITGRRRRRRQKDDDAADSEDDDKKGDTKIDMERPPPVDPRLAASGDLALLVSIVNSCVYCGAFRFRARDVVTLCNVDIDRL